MAYPGSHPFLNERYISTCTNSIASTPLTCVLRIPFRCKIILCSVVSHGTFTTDCSVAIALIAVAAAGAAPGAGTAITGSPMTLTAANSAAGTSITMVPTGANIANEGDLVSFTPSGSTGTTIGGTFTVTIIPA